MGQKPATYQVGTIKNAIKILSVLARSARPLSMSDICHATGIKYNRTYRAVLTLEMSGIVERTLTARSDGGGNPKWKGCNGLGGVSALQRPLAGSQ